MGCFGRIVRRLRNTIPMPRIPSLLSTMLAAACGSRATPATPPAAPSTGALPELDFFVGRWHASAENPATGQRFELVYTVEPILHGRWYRGTGTVAAFDLEILDLWGRDPTTGDVIRTITDSAGTFGTVRSKGWNGDVLVLEGEAATTTGRATVRETITRRGPDAFDAVWESLAEGQWTPYSVEHLRRTPAP